MGKEDSETRGLTANRQRWNPCLGSFELHYSANLDPHPGPHYPSLHPRALGLAQRVIHCADLERTPPVGASVDSGSWSCVTLLTVRRHPASSVFPELLCEHIQTLETRTPCLLSPLPRMPARKSSWKAREGGPGICKIPLRTSNVLCLSQ